MPYRFPMIVAFILLLAVTMGAGRLSASTAPYLESKSRLEILLGKLCVLAPEGQLGKIQLKSAGRVKFRFSLTPDPVGTADFSYFYLNQNYFGRIECQNGFTIQEFWAELPTKKYLRYLQSGAGQEIILEFGTLTEQMLEKIRRANENEDWNEISGQNVQIWKARSFWEFLFSHSTECDEALLFLLSRHWENAKKRISDYREMFQEVLVQNTRERLVASNSQTLESRSLTEIQKKNQKLLRDLASDDFIIRRDADLALRRLGAEIFFLVGELDWQNFDPETQLRLKNILSTAEVNFSLAEKSLILDSQSLMDSPQIWLGVLEFGAEEQKRFALRILSENAELFFEDPAAFRAVSLTQNDLPDSLNAVAATSQSAINSDSLPVATPSLQTSLPHVDENSPVEKSSKPAVKPPKSAPSPSVETSPAVASQLTVWLEKLDKIKKLPLKNLKNQ